MNYRSVPIPAGGGKWKQTFTGNAEKQQAAISYALVIFLPELWQRSGAAIGDDAGISQFHHEPVGHKVATNHNRPSALRVCCSKRRDDRLWSRPTTLFKA